MPRRRVIVHRPAPRGAPSAPSSSPEVPSADALAAAVGEIEQELDLPVAFPAAVVDEASQAAAAPAITEHDRTDLPLVTIDPPGARDLDQALHLARRGSGYLVSYAIADVAAFVAPGGLVDAEAWRRGQTLYAPDHKVALHPPVLSEGAASLLPGEVRPAVLWSIQLDADGQVEQVDARRARVRSRRQLGYDEAQRLLDAGDAPDGLDLLGEVGRLRQDLERERGGVSLALPDQDVVVDDGQWALAYRQVLPVEEWNAQISLLTGMAAAALMVEAGIGVLRTMAPADDGSLSRLRRVARALGLDWPRSLGYPDFVRSLDPATGRGVAMLNACAGAMRGAGYTAFADGPPPHTSHAALATDYTHVTAPLRRLVDRYTAEVALALCAGTEVPAWARERLAELPDQMRASDARARRFERAVLDAVEAGFLHGRLGESFTGTVVDRDRDDARRGDIVIRQPAVEAPVRSAQGDLPLGEEVAATLVEADVATRRVRFELGGPVPAVDEVG